MSTEGPDHPEDSDSGVDRLLRGTYDKRIKTLESDTLKGGTDQSGRARTNVTTKVKECSGDGPPAGFVGGAMSPASPTYLPKAVGTGEASSTSGGKL